MSHDSSVSMTTHGGTMYHSLADSMGGRNRLPRQQEALPVLPMTVIEPGQLSSPITTA